VKRANLLSGRAVTMGWRPRGVILLIAVGSYLAAALFPFDWQARAPHANGLSMAETGALRFESAGWAHTSTSPPWVRAAIQDQVLTVTMRFRSTNGTQTGPARLFTLSENSRACNLMIGQDRQDLVVRIRHPGTSRNGTPPVVLSSVIRPGQSQRFVAVVRATHAEFSIDDHPVVSQEFASSPFPTWDSRYGASIGNEWSLWRPWIGSIDALQVIAGERTVDILRSSHLVRPEELSYTKTAIRNATLTREAWSSEPHDILQNVLGFVPFGFLLFLLFPRSRSFRLLLLVFALSLAMESTQLFADQRKSSPTDLVTNTVGGAIGIAAAGRWLRRREDRLPS